MVVFADADLESAADEVATGIFYNMGQCCVAGSRLLVEESIHDKFLEMLVKRAKNFKVGDSFDKNNNFGPLVSGL